MFEKLQGLVWQLLHDGPRTLRATELRQAALRESPHATPGELALLKDRVRVLHRYNARTAAHGETWPPPASLDGHFDYPSEGCGAFVPEIKPPSQRRCGAAGAPHLFRHLDWLAPPKQSPGKTRCTTPTSVFCDFL